MHSMDSNLWEAWPSPLQELGVPSKFSPSRLLAPLECPVRAFSGSIGDSKVLGPELPALIGNAVHCLMEEYKPADVPTKMSASELLASLICKAITQFPDHRVRGWLPLLGTDKYLLEKASALVLKWSSNIMPSGLERSPSLITRPWDSATVQSIGDSSSVNSEHSEILLESDTLPLKGRADLVIFSPGFVEIIDFKSGRAFDNDGNLRDSSKYQMWAYGLLASELWPDRRVRLTIAADVSIDVPFGRDEVIEIRRHLTQLALAFPKDSPINVSTSAIIGKHCRGCNIRHLCPSYLEKAPREWDDPPPRDQRISGPDLWGEFLGRDASSGSISIVTSFGRGGRIYGLTENEVEQINVGDMVGFFNVPALDLVLPGRVRRHVVNRIVRKNGRFSRGVRCFRIPG